MMNRASSGFESAGDILPSAEPFVYLNVGDADADGDSDIIAELTYYENLKPYSPNDFPAADLEIDLTLVRGNPFTQRVTISHDAGVAVSNVSVAIPVPHGYEWDSTSPGGGSCSLDGHVVLCTRSALGAGETWTLSVWSTEVDDVDPATTYAVASVTADVLDDELTNNVARKRLDQVEIPERRRPVRRD